MIKRKCCKKPMTPYAENLKGDIWVEKCEVCGNIKICTKAKANTIAPAAAARLVKKWAIDCGLDPHE